MRRRRRRRRWRGRRWYDRVRRRWLYVGHVIGGGGVATLMDRSRMHRPVLRRESSTFVPHPDICLPRTDLTRTLPALNLNRHLNPARHRTDDVDTICPARLGHFRCRSMLTIRYDTIREAILTCARKPTRVSLIYRTEGK